MVVFLPKVIEGLNLTFAIVEGPKVVEGPNLNLHQNCKINLLKDTLFWTYSIKNL
jgi:hypothetical protein